MNSRVSRADLLAFLNQQESVELDTVLDCFGYKHPLRKTANGSEKPEDDSPKPPKPPKPPEPPKLLPSERPPEMFYVVQGQEASKVLPAPTQSGQPDIPDWVDSVGNEALTFESARKRFATKPPAHQSLVNWSQLWPLLRNIMSQEHTRKRPDIAKLVKLVANAEQPRRIPQQQREYWSSKVIVLMDRPARLDGLNQDYVSLQKQLEKQRGDTGLECWFVRDLATSSMLVGSERKTWYPPAPETPILILSDLGIYDLSGQATGQWLLFGKKLRQAGCQAFALVPAPASYLSNELSHCFQCVSWDRHSGLKPIKPTATHAETVQQRMLKDQQKADELLVLASMAIDIEPDFLRSLRHQFTLDKPWHIGHELLVWNHEAASQGSNAIILGTKAQGEYRDRLVGLLSREPKLAKTLYQHIRQQLAHTFTLDYIDALCFLGRLAGIEGDERLEASERYLKQYILFTQQQEQHKGLLFNSQLLLSRQDEDSLSQKKYYSSLWAITKYRTGSNAPRPKWLDHSSANAFLSQPTTKMRVQLIQYGEWFYLGTAKTLAESLAIQGFPFNPYVLAEIDIEQNLVVDEYEGEASDHHLEEDAFLKWPVTGKSRVLHLGGQRLDIEALVRPEWAGSFSSGSQGFGKPAIQPTGEDEYGVYFDLKLPDEIVLPRIAKNRGEKGVIDIFLSFSSVDKSLGKKLQLVLTDMGYSVFTYFSIPRGIHWREGIEKSLKLAKCNIVLVTENPAKSAWVKADMRLSQELKKLITLNVGDYKQIPLPLPLFDIAPYFIVEDWNDLLSDKNFHALYREVNKYCRPPFSDDLFKQRFRYIPPQTFLMGSPENEPDRLSDETQHEVTLTQGYWLADTTVTQTLWEAATSENPSHFKGEKRPVEHVSWDDVQAYIEKLKQQWPLLEIRLPSEAEWECACRAGTATAFSFGGKDDLNLENVNYSGKWDKHDFEGETKDVKSFPANPWGLHEMHGNVLEWCQDWSGDYLKESTNDPQGASEESGRRVLRGGTWSSRGGRCRTAFRGRLTPVNRLHFVGFRLALGHLSSGQEQEGRPPVSYLHLYDEFSELAITRAKYFFPIMAELSENSETIFYADLVLKVKQKLPHIEKLAETHYRNVGRALQVIFDFIEIHGLPDMTAIVLSKSSGKPGGGYNSDLIQVEKEQAAVFNENWDEWEEEFERYIGLLMNHPKRKGPK